MAKENPPKKRKVAQTPFHDSLHRIATNLVKIEELLNLEKTNYSDILVWQKKKKKKKRKKERKITKQKERNTF